MVDPDPQLCELLAFSLGRTGLSTVTAGDAAGALDSLEDTQPDVVVLGLDIGTPAGLEVLQTVSRRTQIQVILLGSSRREEELVRGLDLGADDYLVKPFSFPELLARIRARLRRAAIRPTGQLSAPAASLQVGRLTLDPAGRSATYAGQLLRLTPTEFRILEYLLAHAGAVVSTRTLLGCHLGPGARRRARGGACHDAPSPAQAKRGGRLQSGGQGARSGLRRPCRPRLKTEDWRPPMGAGYWPGLKRRMRSGVIPLR